MQRKASVVRLKLECGHVSSGVAGMWRPGQSLWRCMTCDAGPRKVVEVLQPEEEAA